MSKFHVPAHVGNTVLKIVVLSLGLALIVNGTEALKTQPFEVGNALHNALLIPAFWVTLLAPGFYLCALWALSNVFGRMNRGDAFGPNMVRGLKSVGSNLMYGAVCALVIAPTIAPWFDHDMRGFYGVRYDVDIESVTIGLIGLVLYLLARRGQAIKAELEQFV